MAQVRATDRDVGLNSVLSYYITRGNEDLTFRMDRVTGEIATRPSPPDRERQSFYSLVVTVEDEGNPSLSVSHRNVLFMGRMGLGRAAGASLAWTCQVGKGQQAREAMFWWPSHLGDVSGSRFAAMNQNRPQCLLLRMPALF